MNWISVNSSVFRTLRVAKGSQWCVLLRFLTGFFPTKLAGNFQSECPIPMVAIYFKLKCWAIYFQWITCFRFQVSKNRRWRNTRTRFHWSFHETDRAARPENSTTLQVNVVSRGRDGSIGSFLFSQPSFVRQAKIHGRGVVLGRFMMEIQEMPMRIIVRKI